MAEDREGTRRFFLDAGCADSAGFVSRRGILDKVCALNAVYTQDLYLVCRPFGATPKAFTGGSFYVELRDFSHKKWSNPTINSRAKFYKETARRVKIWKLLSGSF